MKYVTLYNQLPPSGYQERPTRHDRGRRVVEKSGDRRNTYALAFESPSQQKEHSFQRGKASTGLLEVGPCVFPPKIKGLRGALESQIVRKSLTTA
jgi:hypothetical protein